jgi:CubicO group peptidase (beta-lactamase class C family)
VLEERLMGTLGIAPSAWYWRDNMYRPDTIQGIKRREFGAGISISVDALARIGLLLLRGGTWDGVPLLAPTTVDLLHATDPALAPLAVHDPASYPQATSHYGLLWWNNQDGSLAGVPADAYWAWGLFENVLVVMPIYGIVAVRCGVVGWQPDWIADYDVIAPFLQPIAGSVLAVSVDEGVELDTWGGVKARWR